MKVLQLFFVNIFLHIEAIEYQLMKEKTCNNVKVNIQAAVLIILVVGDSRDGY
jgi:hypothetical protein